MSASPQNKPASSAIVDEAIFPSAGEIDASCRLPVMLLFFCSALWLLFATGLEALAYFKLTSPGFLADCPYVGYGRVKPAAANALLYGFAAQAGLGVSLWLLARLGRTLLVGGGVIAISTIFWNIGLKLGVLGIFIGDTTGHHWLELPRYASLILLLAYLPIGVYGLLTFQARKLPELYPSQWFVFAALLWFPWVYATAQLLLVVDPAPGAVQTVIGGWYAHNISAVWLSSLGLAVIFYFIPKLLGRPLHSRSQASFSFWSLVFIGTWGGLNASAPLPAWVVAVSVVASTLLLVPLLSVIINIRETACKGAAKLPGDTSFTFVKFGFIGWIVAVLLEVANARLSFAAVTDLTIYSQGQTAAWLLGFFALTMFGAFYYIIPRVTKSAWGTDGLGKIHFLGSVIGAALVIVALVFGGIVQGRGINQANIAFIEVVKSTKLFLSLGLLGTVIFAVAQAALVLSLVKLLVACVRQCTCLDNFKAAKVAGVKA